MVNDFRREKVLGIGARKYICYHALNTQMYIFKTILLRHVMTLLNTSLVRKTTLFLTAAMFSVSTIAADFNQVQREANQGVVEAQAALGSMYFLGQGVRQDYFKAAQWLEKAASQGVVEAQYLLGTMYAEGQGVRQDYAKAVEWLEKAANQGEDAAQYFLGQLYNKGAGVRQNYATAKKWHEKAASQGNARSQARLGAMYYEGRGVRQDYVVAKEWFGKSCDNGDQVGCDLYKYLNQR